MKHYSWLTIIFLFLAIFVMTLVSCGDSGHSDLNEQFDAQELVSPAGDSCGEPYLFSDQNGVVYLSWIEKNNDSAALKFSKFHNSRWSEPAVIANGKNWFINWADYPVIAANGRQNMAAHFLQKNGNGKFAYDIRFSASADTGHSWTAPRKLHTDTVAGEHGFVSMVPYGDYFFVSWLDGRNTTTTQKTDTAIHKGHDMHGGAMSLRAAVVTTTGKTIDEWELDKQVCDCCQTSVAQTSNGPVVVYRDRSQDEVRDITITRFVKGEWQKPKPVFADNWQIKGCPVNGPKVDAINNHLAIAWFSMNNNVAEVKVVFSEDGGASFLAPVKIDEGKTIGRVGLVMLDENSAMVSWMEGATIRSVKVFADGRKGKPFTIANSSASRSAGFPQIAKSGRSLFYAWTDADKKRIRVVKMAARTMDN